MTFGEAFCTGRWLFWVLLPVGTHLTLPNGFGGGNEKHHGHRRLRRPRHQPRRLHCREASEETSGPGSPRGDVVECCECRTDVGGGDQRRRQPRPGVVATVDWDVLPTAGSPEADGPGRPQQALHRQRVVRRSGSAEARPGRGETDRCGPRSRADPGSRRWGCDQYWRIGRGIRAT